MEKQFRVEIFLDGDLGLLYEAVMLQFEKASSLSLSEMNRALLQTGLLLHLTMLSSMGVSPAPDVERLEALAERVGKNNLMWEVVELARRHWREGGISGAIDLHA